MIRKLILLTALFLLPATTQAWEARGNFSTQGRLFMNAPLYEEQFYNTGSLSMEAEFFQDWDGGGFTLSPFLRLDSGDDKRSHADIREFMLLLYGDKWEANLGIGKFFWGVTESQHLVDIINQTDNVEAPDGEEKLGQPMVNLSFPLEWGTFELFMLPYFRERTFIGKKGRLRSPIIVDTNQASYENSDKERHVDYSIRYSHTIGDWEIGISHFKGTARDPSLLPEVNNSGEFILAPYYEQIFQSGIDVQFVYEEWLYKFEGINRVGQHNIIGAEEDYYALTAGFEYTFPSITGGGDIGGLLEWQYDKRQDRATTPSDNDIMAGTRLALNDAEGTEFLFGMVRDLDNSSSMITVEGSRRVSDHLRVNMDLYLFIDQDKDDFLYSLRDDDYIEINLVYYY